MTDDTWQSAMGEIYGAYSVYPHSVFEEGSGRASLRTTYLLELLYKQLQLPEVGQLLDIGCGDGALLREFSRLAPQWTLAGAELDDKYRSTVESIKGVEAFYTHSPKHIHGTYDVITMFHTLEHIPTPREYLASLRGKLKDKGLLVIEVPNFLQNPFDLLVIDHCTHFTATTVVRLLQSVGFEVVLVATDLVPKEITVVVRAYKGKKEQAIQGVHPIELSSISVTLYLGWLRSVVAKARQVSKNGNFGLFGTAIAATWLFGELGESVSFFVDEDWHHAGKTHMGLPVYLPCKVPSGSQVFLPFPTKIAESIQTKMEGMNYKFNCHLPLPFFPIIEQVGGRGQ